jgi:hypothetical protein
VLIASLLSAECDADTGRGRQGFAIHSSATQFRWVRDSAGKIMRLFEQNLRNLNAWGH